MVFLFAAARIVSEISRDAAEGLCSVVRPMTAVRKKTKTRSVNGEELQEESSSWTQKAERRAELGQIGRPQPMAKA